MPKHEDHSESVSLVSWGQLWKGRLPLREHHRCDGRERSCAIAALGRAYGRTDEHGAPISNCEPRKIEARSCRLSTWLKQNLAAA